MNNKNEWPCWTLSKEDINHVAQRLGINPKKFTDDDYEEIGRTFSKGFGWSNEEWELILEEAINLYTVEKNQQLSMR